jgi:hypothetical protein
MSSGATTIPKGWMLTPVPARMSASGFVVGLAALKRWMRVAGMKPMSVERSRTVQSLASLR